MSKEMEALKRMETSFVWNKEGKTSVYKNSTNSSISYYQDFHLVENALKSLEIMKKYLFIECTDDIVRLKQDEGQDWDYTIIMPDTDEEIEILKEVFDDGKQHRLC